MWENLGDILKGIGSILAGIAALIVSIKTKPPKDKRKK